jgi:hypothetical protein
MGTTSRSFSGLDFHDRSLIKWESCSRPVPKRLTFAYGRTQVVSRTLFLVGLIALLVIAVALTPDFPGITIAVIGAVFAAYFVLFTVSPLLTQHWVTRSRLILRQGWYFRTVIPFSDIESISAEDDAGRRRVPLGIHRPLGQPALFVIGGRTGLVSVRLRRPRRFWQAFGLSATEIIFDVNDREGFLAAFEDRRASLSPVQADRPHAELRD